MNLWLLGVTVASETDWRFGVDVCVCLVAQSCPALCNPIDCSPPGSSVHRIFQSRILEWVVMASSRGSSRPRDRTHVSCISCISRWVLYHWATQEAQDWHVHITVLKMDNKQGPGIPDHLTYLLRNLYAGQEATVRTTHGTMDWFKIVKEVHQGCILSPCYLTPMQNTSCEMPGWMKHKLESGLHVEISMTSDMQMIPHLWQKVKN